MSYIKLIDELKLNNRVFAVTRVKEEIIENIKPVGCVYRGFNKLMEEETVYLSQQNIGCKGGLVGIGIKDGLPDTPGGIGYFISHGRGEGFPPGERLRCSPEVAEEMLLNQPIDVMDGFDAIKLEPYKEGTKCDTVTMLATPDQLSALVILFNFRKSGYDTVILPAVSGCSMIFRIPFAELKSENPRGVVGNTDIFSRPHLSKDLLTFTVSANDFKNMIEDIEESFVNAKIWNGIKKRL